jgi:hypothetical protein
MRCKRKENKSACSILSLIRHIDAAIIPVVFVFNCCYGFPFILHNFSLFTFKNNVSGPHLFNPDPDPGFYAEPNIVTESRTLIINLHG